MRRQEKSQQWQQGRSGTGKRRGRFARKIGAPYLAEVPQEQLCLVVEDRDSP